MSVKLSVEIKIKPAGPGVNKIRVMSGKLKKVRNRFKALGVVG